MTTATQPALRSFIEKFSKNCRFILTCNYKNRILEPLHGRFHLVDFSLKKEERVAVATKFIKRLQNDILKAENIECSNDVLQDLVIQHFPDLRKILNQIQGAVVDGKIDEEVLRELNEVRLAELLKYMKKKNFAEMRKWVVNNLDSDFTLIVRSIYNALKDSMKDSDIPQAVLIVHEYLYKSAFVVDPEINLVAFLTELMVTCEFE